MIKLDTTVGHFYMTLTLKPFIMLDHLVLIIIIIIIVAVVIIIIIIIMIIIMLHHTSDR